MTVLTNTGKTNQQQELVRSTFGLNWKNQSTVKVMYKKDH